MYAICNPTNDIFFVKNILTGKLIKLEININFSANLHTDFHTKVI